MDETDIFGYVLGAGDGGKIVRETGGYFIIGTSMALDDNDDEIVFEFRDGPYPTFEALVAELPPGIKLVPVKE